MCITTGIGTQSWMRGLSDWYVTLDTNMNMMSACPVSPLFHRYGQGDNFPSISQATCVACKWDKCKIDEDKGDDDHG